MWRAILASTLVLWALASAAAESLRSGEGRVALVELFTSEGCSSCPPADRWMSRLVDSPRLWREVVPVAFHVDYWDYIGWPDRFAAPNYGRRQSDYRRAGHTKGVYTPGFIVGGREWRGWFRDPTLRGREAVRIGPLTVELTAGAFEARFEPAVEVPARLELNVAILGFDLSTDVRGGENSGRTLEHDFVVLGWHRVGLRREAGAYLGTGSLPTPRVESSRRAVAVWVSPAGDPYPIQAAGGWLD